MPRSAVSASNAKLVVSSGFSFHLTRHIPSVSVRPRTSTVTVAFVAKVIVVSTSVEPMFLPLVKNGIVLVDYINLLRERGIELNEAIALSGQSRLRPIMMTAFTTILGMIPRATSRAEGSEMWTTMGLVVIGGLTVSTFVTLLIVPVLYGIFNRRGDIEKKEKERRKFVFMNIDLDEKK